MSTVNTHTFQVPDISCQHCIDAITSEVSAVPDVQSLQVDLEAKTVMVVGGENDALIAAIDDAGFDVSDDPST